MAAGMIKKSKKGFMVRFDYAGVKYTDADISRAKGEISEFVKDLYNSLDEKSREMIFGKINSS